MQALSQSSFLQALGYAIANSFWQVALLWLISLLINAVIKLSSHNRYGLAITAQLSGFSWFVVTLQFYYQQCIKATANAQLLLQQNAVVYQPEVLSNKYNILSYIAKAEMLLPYLSLAYLCLLCVLALRWLKSYRYTHRLKLNGLQKADMELRLFVQNMAAQLGIKQKVKIYFSSLVTCPLTIGFLKPIILVPVATVNHLTTQQLEAVLLHELAHIRRADYLVNLLLNVIETILFFNPFTRLISQNINKEREHCCDDWVLQFKYNAPMYAEALLRIACLQASPTIAMKAEGKSEGELLWRVKRLLNHQQKRFNYSQQMIALVVTTCMLVATAWLQPAKTPKQPQVAAVKPAKAVVVAPMAVQINNPFFNPLALLSKPLKEEVQKATAEIAQTDLHQVIKTGLDEADKTFTTVTPTVLQELDEMNKDSSIEQAVAAAKKELKKINWTKVRQLAPIIDSVYINKAIGEALNKNKVVIDLNKIKESITASKAALAKLKQQNIEALIDQSYYNAAINNAATWIGDNDFLNAWNENTKSPAKQQTKERKDKQREQAMILRRLMENRVAPRVGSFTLRLPKQKDCNKINESADRVRDHAEELANWTYTNPVYVEQAVDERDDEENEDSIYSYAAQPPASPAPPAAPATKPLVQVVEVTNDNEHVSIIITIKQ